ERRVLALRHHNAPLQDRPLHRARPDWEPRVKTHLVERRARREARPVVQDRFVRYVVEEHRAPVRGGERRREEAVVAASRATHPPDTAPASAVGPHPLRPRTPPPPPPPPPAGPAGGLPRRSSPLRRTPRAASPAPRRPSAAPPGAPPGPP